KLNEMHRMVNQLYKVQEQLKDLLPSLEGPIRKSGQELLNELESWDEDMVQRKSQAYDDVENFPNKFTAEYIFLIDQSNSVIPRINQGSRDRKKELDLQWNVLKKRGQQLSEEAIPEYNKALWGAGIGAIQLN
ncbi:MAG: glycosyl hydrolase, partial [Muriicola sp.]|nr:glycosyl hydrolase [Muriicola sp.]NNK35567.1 glycosyl hydrolase [Eudoraea sp.]